MKSKGIIYIVIATMLMSTGGLFIKLIQAGAISIAFGRGLVAGLFFLPFVKWRSIKITPSFLALVFSYSGLVVGFVFATKMTTAANAIILQCTAPLWLYIAYIITGKRPIVAKELIPRICILCGILVIFMDPGNEGGGAERMLGNCIALAAGIAYAIEQYFMEKHFPMDDRTILGVANYFMCMFILLFFWKDISFSGMTPLSWALLVFLGVLQIGVSYLFFLKGVRLVSALESSVLSLLEPILNPILVFVFMGEIPGIYTMIGYVVIMGGVVMTLLPQKNSDEIIDRI